MRDYVVECSSPVIHEPFETLKGDVYATGERRTVFAIRFFTNDASMAEVFFFSWPAEPVSPANLTFDNSDGLFTGVVAQVLERYPSSNYRELE